METYQLLLQHFKKKKRSSKNSSLRAIAKRLDISPSFLSRIFRGEKPIPYSLLIRLGPELDIDPEVFASIRSSHEGHALPLKTKGRAKIRTQLENFALAPESSFPILRQWFYAPILDLVTLANFDGKVSTIAKRLGLAPESAEIAVRELLAANLLESKRGRLQKTHTKIRFSSHVSRSEIRNFHNRMLERSQAELRHATTDRDFANRLITSLTVGVSVKKIEAAKTRLSEALHEIANDLAAGEGEEVYLLAAQLIPLTK